MKRLLTLPLASTLRGAAARPGPASLCVRNLSFFDKLMSQGANEKQAEEQFKQQMVSYAETPVFTFLIFKNQLKKAAEQGGAMGWRSFLPQQLKPAQMEAEEIKKQLQIAESIIAKECMDNETETLPFPLKQQICKDAQCEASEINLVLRRYLMAKSIHQWVQSRRERGLPLPEKAEDFTSMAQQDPIRYPASIVRVVKNSSKREQQKMRRGRR